MERLKERTVLAEKALKSLKEALDLPYSKIVRDAAIQRFEFTLESIWKLAQRYLMIQEGYDIGSPKGVIKSCFQVGLLNEEQTELLLQSVDDRNLSVHTYNESLAEEIYKRLSGYCRVLETLFQSIKTSLKNSPDSIAR